MAQDAKRLGKEIIREEREREGQNFLIMSWDTASSRYLLVYPKGEPRSQLFKPYGLDFEAAY